MGVVDEGFLVASNIGIGHEAHVHLVVCCASQLINIQFRFFYVDEICNGFLFLLLDQLISENFDCLLDFCRSSLEPSEHLHLGSRVYLVIKNRLAVLVQVKFRGNLPRDDLGALVVLSHDKTPEVIEFIFEVGKFNGLNHRCTLLAQ